MNSSSLPFKLSEVLHEPTVWHTCLGTRDDKVSTKHKLIPRFNISNKPLTLSCIILSLNTRPAETPTWKVSQDGRRYFCCHGTCQHDKTATMDLSPWSTARRQKPIVENPSHFAKLSGMELQALGRTARGPHLEVFFAWWPSMLLAP